MNKWFSFVVLAAVVLIGAIYWSELRYKYSCQSDDKCYPCTRWMNCVSEDFYLQNTGKCRGGGEENFSRIVCGCSSRGRCQTLQIKPESAHKENMWVPAE